MKASTHNSELLARLVTAYVDLVYAAALRQVRDAHPADDVTQAVFLVVMRKMDRLPEEALMPGWLLKATRYTALMALRADRRRKRNEWAAGVKAGGRDSPKEMQVEAVGGGADAEVFCAARGKLFGARDAGDNSGDGRRGEPGCGDTAAGHA